MEFKDRAIQMSVYSSALTKRPVWKIYGKLWVKGSEKHHIATFLIEERAKKVCELLENCESISEKLVVLKEILGLSISYYESNQLALKFDEWEVREDEVYN